MSDIPEKIAEVNIQHARTLLRLVDAIPDHVERLHAVMSVVSYVGTLTNAMRSIADTTETVSGIELATLIDEVERAVRDA